MWRSEARDLQPLLQREQFYLLVMVLLVPRLNLKEYLGQLFLRFLHASLLYTNIISYMEAMHTGSTLM